MKHLNKRYVVLKPNKEFHTAFVVTTATLYICGCTFDDGTTASLSPLVIDMRLSSGHIEEAEERE